MIDSLLLANPDSNIMITGDFNNFDSSVFLQQFSLHNCVIAPTRKDSFLDQIWINSALASQYADNASICPPLSSSDHSSVMLVGKKIQLSSNRIVKVWDFRKSNIDRFCQNLSATDFSNIPTLDNVNDMCCIFYDRLRQAIASAIPFEYVTLSQRDKPWVSPLLKSLINKRWNAFRNKQWPLFAHYKVKVKNEIMKAKYIWTERQITSSKNIWKVVNETRGKTSTNCYTSLIQDFGGIENFLSAVQDVLRNNFNNKNDDDLGVMDSDPFSDLWSFQATSFDVFTALRKVKLNKSSGSDDIPNRLLKEGASWLSPVSYTHLTLPTILLV